MHNFEQAWELVEQLHKQNGDPNGLSFIKPEAREAVRRYAHATEWINDFYRRTDLSDDDKWEYECWEHTMRVLFSLMGKTETPLLAGEIGQQLQTKCLERANDLKSTEVACPPTV